MWVLALVGVVLIGIVDYLSGVELRVFPLYYLPISLVGWHRGRAPALVVAGICAISWFESNYQAGLQFTHPGIWVSNAIAQAVSFATVGVLIATLTTSLH